MIPYPVGARVRVGDEWGSIVSATGESHFSYHVAFDAKTYGDDQKERVNVHEDIRQGYHDGMPLCIALVEPEMFIALNKSYCTGDIGRGQQADRKTHKPLVSIPIPNPVLWNGFYWSCTSAAYDMDNETYSFSDLVRLIPFAEYDGEIREPHFLHRSYRGYRVTCALGEFVITDICRAVAPTTPIRMDDESSEAMPLTRDRPKIEVRSAASRQKPIQMNFFGAETISNDAETCCR